MIDIKVIASGSKGNCTAVTAGTVTILLDAGVSFEKIQQALNFENPTACLITHEHGDHANKATIAELLKRGTEVYMTAGTANALNLETSHRLHLIKQHCQVYLLNDKDTKKSVWFLTYPVSHDAAEPVCFEIYHDYQSIFYLTDSGEIPYPTQNSTYLLIEANHDEDDLLKADIDERQRQRILNNHLSIQKVINAVQKAVNNPYIVWLKEVHLLHISKRHGDGEQFRQAVQAVVGDNIKVFAH